VTRIQGAFNPLTTSDMHSRCT